MTRRKPLSVLLLPFILAVSQAPPVRAEGDPVRSFQTLAERVIAAFQAATDGIKLVRVDVRRRDTLPEADVQMLGVLRFDLKPKDGSPWHSVRCVFGYRDGQWRFLNAFRELPSERPTWAEAGPWYEAVVERVLKSAQ